MPSTSPGHAPNTPTPFVQVSPGAPTSSLQTLTSFIFRHRRYIAYFSGRQLNLLSSPNVLVQALTFEEKLVAVAAENHTGKIAVASKSEVWALESVTEGWTKVSWEKSLFLRREDAGDEARWLSWGNDGELLVGGTRQISLFSTLPSSRTSAAPPEEDDTTEERRTLWSKGVSSPIQYAAFSPSATLIATCGRYDRLVKIWRRLSFEEGLFDHTYLPHARPVTHLQWRTMDEHSDVRRSSGMSGRQDDDTEVLFTTAADGVLRVWKSGGAHDLDIMMLHTTVDLVSAIPQSPSLSIKGETPARHSRYACILPSDQFCAAVTAAIGLPNDNPISHSLEHLKEVASKEPDIVISFDGQGRMSAWGLQSIGHKRRPDTPSGQSKLAYHITHAEGLPNRVTEGMNARFEAWFEDNAFDLVVHTFEGEIRWWHGDVEGFFSPSVAGSERLREVGCWAGHQSGPITQLRASSESRDVISWSSGEEIVHWRIGGTGIIGGAATYSIPNKVINCTLLPSGNDCGDFAATLEVPGSSAKGLDLLLRDSMGCELSRSYSDLSRNNRFWRLSTSANSIVGLDTDGGGFVSAICWTTPRTPQIQDRTDFSLPVQKKDDPLVHLGVVLDNPDKLGVVGIARSGSLMLYHLDLGIKADLDPKLVATFESGVSDASLLTVHNEVAAVVSSNLRELAIVNLTDGYVEYRHVGADKIRHVVAASKHTMLAVGYDTTVEILAQGRYAYVEDKPLWIRIKQVSIAGVGLIIDCLSWLSGNSLALAAGNGLFISSNDVPSQHLQTDVQEAIDAKSHSLETVRLSQLAFQLKKPLPAWHPSFVAHIVRHGHWALAASLVTRLLQKLRFWSEGDDLPPLLNIPGEHLYGAEAVHNENVLEQDTVAELIQQLEEKDLPEVSQNEQERLKRVLQAMMYCSEHVEGLDNGALRFLFSWKLELLQMDAKDHQENGSQPNGISRNDGQAVPLMHWREIAFAYHSTTQQPLLDIFIEHYNNKITWNIARRLGLFAWLCEREALNQIFEALAQSTYRSTNPPDPINASLYFLALHKKPTLLALWRIATWHKEQRATMNFLRRDFTQIENRTSAKKNAYALLGKRRFDYAAAFFLLAEDGTSATRVLAGQCDDVMLAIAVARLYSGDGSACLRTLLEDRLMPQATKNGDRWLLSWCHSILMEKRNAADGLIKPLDGVRTWQQDDPSTLTLYRQLRKTDSDFEYEAVLRAARVLRRMGLLLVALELVSRWEFKVPQRTKLQHREEETIANGVHEEADPQFAQEPPSMLDGFEAAPEDGKDARAAQAAELLKKIKAKKDEPDVSAVDEKKAEPTQFQEPEANSLLDSFGF